MQLKAKYASTRESHYSSNKGCAKIEPEICIIFPTLRPYTSYIRTSLEIAFNSVAQGRGGSINSLCSTWPGCIDQQNRSSSNLLSCCFYVPCVLLSSVIVLIYMSWKTALIMCGSQGRASIRCSTGQNVIPFLHGPPNKMIFLLAIHSIFVCVCCITFIYWATLKRRAFGTLLSLFWLCRIKCTPSGVISHDKNHKAFEMSLFICCTSSQALRCVDFQHLLKCLHRCVWATAIRSG